MEVELIKFEVGGWRLDFGGWRLEVGGRRSEVKLDLGAVRFRIRFLLSLTLYTILFVWIRLC